MVSFALTRVGCPVDSRICRYPRSHYHFDVTAQIPESLGLAVGLVFLVCVVLFQQLHYYDASGMLAFISNGMKGEMHREV